MDSTCPGHHITTEQIDAAVKEVLRFECEMEDNAPNRFVLGFFWVLLGKLGIKQCDGCGGSGRMVLDEAPDGRVRYDRCMDCNGHKWTKE